jgi:hypothetical protein
MSDSNSARPGVLAAPDPESLLAPRLACAALAGLAAVQLILPGPGAPTQIDFRAARRPRPVAAPPLPEYPAILRAPLFAPDRHPGEAAPATASGQGASLDGFTALGVVVGGAANAAVISGPSVGAQTVKRGEMVNGWRLIQVSPTAAMFERGGVRQTLVVGAPAAAAASSGDPDAPGGLAPAANAMPENAPQAIMPRRRK